MSITREQAATWFETMHPPGPAAREMYRMAAKALRPVTRERAEKVWRGEWKENKNAAIESVVCSKCNTVFQGYYCNYQFCPRCGTPMTGKAVEMVMERVEQIKCKN